MHRAGKVAAHRHQHLCQPGLSFHTHLSQAMGSRMEQEGVHTGSRSLLPLLLSGGLLWPQPPGPCQEPGIPHICWASPVNRAHPRKGGASGSRGHHFQSEEGFVESKRKSGVWNQIWFKSCSVPP